MELSEMKKAAAVYAGQLRREENRRLKESSKKPTNYDVDRAKFRLRESLAKLPVQQTLEMIQKSWGEGEIEAFDEDETLDPVAVGLQLVSKPFRVVDLVGQGKSRTIQVKEDERLRFGIYASTTDIFSGKTDRIDVTTATYSMQDGRSVWSYIEQNGLFRGLERGAVLRLREGLPIRSELEPNMILPMSTNNFLFLVNRDWEFAQAIKSNPQTIRAWNERVIDEIPSAKNLGDREILDPQELRNWGHEVQNHWKLHRYLDKKLARTWFSLPV